MNNKKSTSLVDSFVFKQAKQNTDLINNLNSNDQKDNIDFINTDLINKKDNTDLINKKNNTDLINKKDNTDLINNSNDNNKNTDLIYSNDNKPPLILNQYSFNINISDPIWNLTDRQAIILGYLILNQSKLFQRKNLIQATSISEACIKHSLKILHTERFITKPIRWKNNGSVYDLYQDVCKRFIDVRWPEILKKYGDPPKIVIKSNSTKDQNDDNKTLIKSNSTNIKLSEIETMLESHPELGYWRQLKLTAKQVQSWLRITCCNLDVMAKYLSYCAFDMIDNEKQKSLKKTPFDYFFRVIENSGQYPKPNSYKSYQQKQIEDMEILIAEKEAEAKKIEELRQKQWKIENDLEFQKMMNDPECELYKKCFDNLNSFSKTLKGIGFEKSMRVSYEKIINNN